MTGDDNDAAALTLRPFVETDAALLRSWLGRPHVRAWWHVEEAGLVLDTLRARYAPQALAAEGVRAWIVLLGARPIGYAQDYVAMAGRDSPGGPDGKDGPGGGWWPDQTDPGVRGIDQFLAEPGDLGRGLGTRLVRALVEMLFGDPAVTRVQTDPDPDNARAIRCYEKAGFRACGRIVTPDGPALYMVCERPAAGSGRSAIDALVAKGGLR